MFLHFTAQIVVLSFHAQYLKQVIADVGIRGLGPLLVNVKLLVVNVAQKLEGFLLLLQILTTSLDLGLESSESAERTRCRTKIQEKRIIHSN